MVKHVTIISKYNVHGGCCLWDIVCTESICSAFAVICNDRSTWNYSMLDSSRCCSHACINNAPRQANSTTKHRQSLLVYFCFIAIPLQDGGKYTHKASQILWNYYGSCKGSILATRVWIIFTYMQSNYSKLPQVQIAIWASPITKHTRYDTYLPFSIYQWSSPLFYALFTLQLLVISMM